MSTILTAQASEKSHGLITALPHVCEVWAALFLPEARPFMKMPAQSSAAAVSWHEGKYGLVWKKEKPRTHFTFAKSLNTLQGHIQQEEKCSCQYNASSISLSFVFTILYQEQFWNVTWWRTGPSWEWQSLIGLNKGGISSFLLLNLRHALERPMQFSALFSIFVQFSSLKMETNHSRQRLGKIFSLIWKSWRTQRSRTTNNSCRKVLSEANRGFQCEENGAPLLQRSLSLSAHFLFIL